MTLERITEDNLHYAVSVQEELFPGESARTNYEESLLPETDYEYYLLYEGGACAGIIGLYRYPEDADSAWLGWFGIRRGFRRRALGSTALKLFEDMAAARGIGLRGSIRTPWTTRGPSPSTGQTGISLSPMRTPGTPPVWSTVP